MSMLIFYVGENIFAIDCQYVERVIPFVDLKAVPSFPNYLPGFLNLKGKTIPIIDFCQLIENRSSQFVLSTRIIIIKSKLFNSEQMLGVLGEHVSDFLDAKLEKFNPIDIHLNGFSFINHVFSQSGKIIQYLDVENFFSFIDKEIFQQKENHSQQPTT